MHAFASVNMLGAMLGAPLIARLADRFGRQALLVAVLALVDAVLLLACLASSSVPMLLALRTLEGATHVGTLSIVLGALAHRRWSSGRSTAAAAGGVMFAVALGPAFGGALLRFDVALPLRAAAGLLASVGTLALVFPAALGGAERRPRASVAPLARVIRSPLVFVPSALALVERFTIGCFVVTFALYAHRVRHLTDAQVSVHYSFLLLPFAIATYPLAGGTAKWSRASLIRAGGWIYGAAFVVLAWVEGVGLALALVVAGVASAMVYGPSLGFVAAAGRTLPRATAMAVFHAAGCFGMMLGPAVAGIVSSLVGRAGASDQLRYGTVFVLAGLVQLGAMRLLRSRIAGLRTLEDASPKGDERPAIVFKSTSDGGATHA